MAELADSESDMVIRKPGWLYIGSSSPSLAAYPLRGYGRAVLKMTALERHAHTRTIGDAEIEPISMSTAWAELADSESDMVIRKPVGLYIGSRVASAGGMSSGSGYRRVFGYTGCLGAGVGMRGCQTAGLRHTCLNACPSTRLYTSLYT